MAPSWAARECARCGKAIVQAEGGRPRRFCCNGCRQAVYRVTKAARTGQAVEGYGIVRSSGVAPSPAGRGQGDVYSDATGGM